MWAVLQFGSTWVAVDQREAPAVESRDDLIESRAPALGSIRFAGADRPVFALDAQLVPQRAISPESRACAILRHESELFGLLCDDIAILSALEAAEFDLPPAMRLADTPIHSLVRINDQQLAVRSSARALAQRLGVGSSDQRSSPPAEADALALPSAGEAA